MINLDADVYLRVSPGCFVKFRADLAVDGFNPSKITFYGATFDALLGKDEWILPV